METEKQLRAKEKAKKKKQEQREKLLKRDENILKNNNAFYIPDENLAYWTFKAQAWCKKPEVSKAEIRATIRHNSGGKLKYDGIQELLHLPESHDSYKNRLNDIIKERYGV